MFDCKCVVAVSAAALVALSAVADAAKYDPRMALENAVTVKGVQWLDGRYLPLEGKAFADVDRFYDRLPRNVTRKVNAGVRNMKSHTAGMQFRFRTDSPALTFRWSPTGRNLAMDHMPATGMSGIDVYEQGVDGKWLYVKTGRIRPDAGGAAPTGTLHVAWKPGTPCLVNLPLYNGIQSFALGVKPGSKVEALPPRASGVTKPVVFYGTSITHGGCASRPGLAFPSIVGRTLDVPIVNLGFSGSGVMELEMSEHLAAIDASCYVLDCLWNMGMTKADDVGSRRGRNVDENYEPFIRNLRARRPDVPIVMAERCDVYCRAPNSQDRFIKALYEKLIAEGWTNLVYLSKDGMYTGDREGTVDGCHPNDWGMMSMGRAFSAGVARALKLPVPNE